MLSAIGRLLGVPGRSATPEVPSPPADSAPASPPPTTAPNECVSEARLAGGSQYSCRSAVLQHRTASPVAVSSRSASWYRLKEDAKLPVGHTHTCLCSCAYSERCARKYRAAKALRATGKRPSTSPAPSPPRFTPPTCTTAEPVFPDAYRRARVMSCDDSYGSGYSPVTNNSVTPEGPGIIREYFPYV
jgi:hypothetical protein